MKYIYICHIVNIATYVNNSTTAIRRALREETGSG